MKHKEILFANLIADLVVEKLHNDFAFKIIDQDIDIDDKLSINDLLNNKFSLEEDEEEKLISELAKLTTLLVMYEEKELYEKAAIIKNKIRIINKKLNND
jgi:protein-arginine kinase activator protein McsA